MNIINLSLRRFASVYFQNKIICFSTCWWTRLAGQGRVDRAKTTQSGWEQEELARQGNVAKATEASPPALELGPLSSLGSLADTSWDHMNELNTLLLVIGGRWESD